MIDIMKYLIVGIVSKEINLLNLSEQHVCSLHASKSSNLRSC